jgi:predicted O-methyltransferase YrrM
MKFNDISYFLKGIPHTPVEDGKILYDFVLRNKLDNILELGFQHGVSTLYMAAAMDETGSGKIYTIDRLSAQGVKPTIYDLMIDAGLEKYIEPVFANSSYIWELRKLIEISSRNGKCEPIFDFCFIDGAHNWETDGFAFFLVDKLLKKGGWILFDDMFWSYSISPAMKDTELVKNLPEDEKTIPQIESVFKLLVSQHPDYFNFIIKGRWGWAQKINKSGQKNNTPDDIYLSQSIIVDIKQILRKIKSKF